MSSSNTSETTPSSPGPSTSKKQPVSDSVSNDSSEGRDLLRSLKGQVSFAKQCLGLLQNQMKHAMDTLDILQDQVNKAQSTIDKIERKNSKQTDQKAVVSSEYQTSDDQHDSAVPTHAHRMVVVDSSGQPLYAIDKSAAASYGVPMPHQGGVCHCPSCVNVSLGHPVFITEQNQQLIAVHPGQSVYHIDGKQVVSPSSHESNDKKEEQQTEHTSQKKRKHSMSDSEESNSPDQNTNESNKGESEGKSTSPITSQLLQVLDVLQNAGDDDCKEIARRSIRGESPLPFTGPVPISPIHSASGTGILAVSRRCRKQDMSPFIKREEPGLLHLHKPEREYPELMKVPPPVLAATLEPDFLVVPGNSYFSESPPSSAGGVVRERHGSSERRSSETRSSEFKKEHVENAEPRRSSSTSSLSQNSETSSRSPSESSERSAPTIIDASKKCDATSEIVCHTNRVIDQENTSRDQRTDANTPSKAQSNGDFHKSNTMVTPGDSKLPQPIRVTPKISLLNSTTAHDKDTSEPTSPSQLSPKKSPVRLIKVSPLNSVVTGSNMVEIRRPSLEYTSNHGIVRISSATSMTSPNLKHVAPESPTFSNNVHKTSIINTYVNSSHSESDLPMVTTAYSVAQFGNDERICTSPSKRPNILSRTRSQNKKDIPQGIVVLVPTIEDAKQLIKSSGGNQGNTPVLVPQNVLNHISSNGEASRTTADSQVPSSFVGKRPHYSNSNISYSRPKRSLSEPLVID